MCHRFKCLVPFKAMNCVGSHLESPLNSFDLLLSTFLFCLSLNCCPFFFKDLSLCYILGVLSARMSTPYVNRTCGNEKRNPLELHVVRGSCELPWSY